MMMRDIPATPNIVWKTSTQSPGLSPIPPPSKSYILARSNLVLGHNRETGVGLEEERKRMLRR